MKERIRRQSFAATLLALSLAAPSAAQDEPLEIAELVFDTQERVGIPRPKGWKYTSCKSYPSKESEIAAYDIFRCAVDTAEFGEFDIFVTLLNGCRTDPVRQAIYEKIGFAPRARDRKVTLDLSPVPNNRYLLANEPEIAYLVAHLPGNGRSVSIVFKITADRLERARPAMLNVARQVVVQLPLWPVRPAGFERVELDGIEVAFDATIDKRDRRSVLDIVRDTARQFERVHGEHGFDERVPFEIYFTEDANARRELLLSDEEVPHVYGVPILHRVASLLPTTPKQRGELASQIIEGLWSSIYPLEGCLWLRFGEQQLGWMQQRCGRPLPSVPQKSLDSMQRVRLDLNAINARDELYLVDCGTWTTFFRIGPSKYRKAYKALLAELRTTHDPKALMTRFVESFDTDKVMKAARKTMGKLKGLR